MTETWTVRAALVAAWVGAAAPLAGAPGDGASTAGAVALRWNLVTERDGLRPDFQELGAQLRLSTAPAAWRGLRFHLEGDARRGLDERFAGADNPYRDRRRVRRAAVEVGRLLGGSVELGRHRPALLVLGAQDEDGATWRAARGPWSAALTGGSPVPYWEPDAGFDGGRLQWGGEVGWRGGAGAEAGAGLLREEDGGGARRWRLGFTALAPRRAGASWRGRAEVDPRAGRWLQGRLAATWRPGLTWSLQADVGERRVSTFPVAAADSAHFDGRSHELGLRLQRRWRSGLTASLRVRSNYGDRPLRVEELYLSWRGLGAPFGAMAAVRLTDSWSPWRQLERLAAQWQWRGRRPWSLAAGAAVTAFTWEGTAASTSGVRLRPHLEARWLPGRAWVWSLSLDETVDEFAHLRTGAVAGVTYRL